MSNKFKNWLIGFCSMIISCVIIMPITIALDIDSSVSAWIMLIIGAIVWAFATYKINTMTEKYVSYASKTLLVKKRSAIAKKSIILKRFYKEGATYKPAEIVYSGMTVGGVSVGSAHVNEAHYESYGIKTDKFLMYYGEESKPIEKIVCTFDIPQNSAISKYCINKNTILVKNPDGEEKLDSTHSQMLYNNMASGNKAMEAHIIGQHLEQKFLSKKECQTIISWIGGEIN